jgi:predicted naringenin-chalcone synthase
MTWILADHGMAMTLARDVPERLASVLRDFVHELYARAGRPRLAMLDSIFAVHPGGPKIIDAVRDRLELDEAQVAHSRAVLRDHGNMSSATLPHVWMRLAEDRAITDGALIASIAFGPGLTLAGALFEKRS